MYWRVLREHFRRLFRTKNAISARHPCCPCQTASPPRASMESELSMTPIIGREHNFGAKVILILLFNLLSMVNRDRPCTTSCSFKAHLVAARSPGSSPITIGTQPSLPSLYCSDQTVQSENNFSFTCPSIGNDRESVCVRCLPRSIACYLCMS